MSDQQSSDFSRTRIPIWDILHEDQTQEEDRFGHLEVVNALLDVLVAVQALFCVGIVGDWGVGKSFILRRLEEELLGRNQHVFYFNAWKYAGESVKRSVLDVVFHRCDGLDEETKRKWTDQLYRTRTEPTGAVAATSIKIFSTRVLVPVLIAL